MSTTMSARGIAGSLRLVGATAAVAAGIAGFAAVSAAPAGAATDVGAAQFRLTDAQGAALTQLVGNLNLPHVTLKAKTCTQMDKADVPTAVLLKLGCIVVPDSGEIIGGSIFS